MFNATPGAQETDYETGYPGRGHRLGNRFQYHFDDVAVVPMKGYNFTRMDPGQYRLEWEYEVSTCSERPPNTIVYGPSQVVASGSLHFSVVDDGSGLDFDIPLDECPVFGDTWAVRDAMYSGCPFLGSSEDVERDPCEARLESREQVQCIREFLFEGSVEVPNNETETCLDAFERVDRDWFEYIDDDDDDDDDDNDDDRDSAVSVRPGLLDVAIAAVVALAL
ncbi:hypothetical protein BDW59DRAFT_145159 [Aspergillus cavernicola]|uniref:Uncharacterized protein n=1 Tax=Aspergillus cavernicola TaxID=176166 RepID=A0ABR4IFA8_9EURO